MLLQHVCADSAHCARTGTTEQCQQCVYDSHHLITAHHSHTLATLIPGTPATRPTAVNIFYLCILNVLQQAQRQI